MPLGLTWILVFATAIGPLIMCSTARSAKWRFPRPSTPRLPRGHSGGARSLLQRRSTYGPLLRGSGFKSIERDVGCLPHITSRIDHRPRRHVGQITGEQAVPLFINRSRWTIGLTQALAQVRRPSPHAPSDGFLSKASQSDC